MGFSLGRLLGSPLRATSQLFRGKPLQAFKTGVTGGGTAPFASKAPFLGGGGIAGGIREMLQPSAEAQGYFNTFSPEDQGNIKASLAGNPSGMNDWFKNAQAAGAVPPSVAPQGMAPPSSPIGPDVDRAAKMNRIRMALTGKRTPFEG